MTGVIQQLVVMGQARLYESSVFLAATSSQSQELEPPTNAVWLVYEVELVPHDINLSVALTGPNITAGMTIRSLGYPSEGAYLALPQAPLTAAWANGTDSAAYGILRYLSLTAERYRTLVNPSYAGESPGWLKTLAATGHQAAKGAHHG